MAAAGIGRRLRMRGTWALTSLGDWMDYLRRRARFSLETRGLPVHVVNRPVGERTRHVYRIAGDRVLTTSQMDQRWKIVTRLYPPKLTSLLDIGCCRGWFVIRAAMDPTCTRAVGIDVLPEFIDAANEGARHLKLDHAQFYYAFLDDLVREPEKYKPPYQTILLINTYHYMYWGSRLSPRHWADHEYLLSTLAGLCTDRLIFMSPLEVDECPSDIRDRAREHPEWAAAYTTDQFLATARKYFDVSFDTYLGMRPLYLMKKK